MWGPKVWCVTSHVNSQRSCRSFEEFWALRNIVHAKSNFPLVVISLSQRIVMLTIAWAGLPLLIRFDLCPAIFSLEYFLVASSVQTPPARVLISILLRAAWCLVAIPSYCPLILDWCSFVWEVMMTTSKVPILLLLLLIGGYRDWPLISQVLLKRLHILKANIRYRILLRSGMLVEPFVLLIRHEYGAIIPRGLMIWGAGDSVHLKTRCRRMLIKVLVPRRCVFSFLCAAAPCKSVFAFWVENAGWTVGWRESAHTSRLEMFWRHNHDTVLTYGLPLGTAAPATDPASGGTCWEITHHPY
jgi:hypothetical protein